MGSTVEERRVKLFASLRFARNCGMS